MKTFARNQIYVVGEVRTFATEYKTMTGIYKSILTSCLKFNISILTALYLEWRIGDSIFHS